MSSPLRTRDLSAIAKRYGFELLKQDSRNFLIFHNPALRGDIYSTVSIHPNPSNPPSALDAFEKSMRRVCRHNNLLPVAETKRVGSLGARILEAAQQNAVSNDIGHAATLGNLIDTTPTDRNANPQPPQEAATMRDDHQPQDDSKPRRQELTSRQIFKVMALLDAHLRQRSDGTFEYANSYSDDKIAKEIDGNALQVAHIRKKEFGNIIRSGDVARTPLADQLAALTLRIEALENALTKP
jgi:hypothetical protein